VRDGLDQLANEHGVDLRDICTVVHGTTIAVNTLIQRTGARLGLLVTEGFRDVLELQRLRLPNPFDLDGSRPLPLIPRSRVAEVRERLRADGRIDTPLDEGSVRESVRHLVGHEVEGLVISLLHAYRNPLTGAGASHRRGRGPGLPVSNSADVWPQARSTSGRPSPRSTRTCSPRSALPRSFGRLSARGVPAAPYVTKSNGGIMPVAAARGQTVAALLSGRPRA
jgi:N-methylhydantoinase A